MRRGGAERQLIYLIKNLNKYKFRVGVLLFYDEGPLLSDLYALNDVEIFILQKKSRWDIFGFVARLIKTTRSFNADVVYGFLDVPNIFAFLAGKMSGANVVFGVRSSNMDFKRYGLELVFVYWLEILLSHFTDRLIVNSHAGFEYHARKGISPEKMEIVPNGFDGHYYQKSIGKAMVLRKKWGISESYILIGLVGRIDPMKGHETFLQMADILQSEFSQLRFVCVGEGERNYWQALISLANDMGLGKIHVWAGTQTDMPAVYNAIDILVSSSLYGEGFSNVIGEAMLCEVPCVVTDVGDSALIVADNGRVVAPNDPFELADAVSEIIRMPEVERFELGKQARQRIVNEFKIEDMVAATERVLEKLTSSSQ